MITAADLAVNREQSMTGKPVICRSEAKQPLIYLGFFVVFCFRLGKEARRSTTAPSHPPPCTSTSRRSDVGDNVTCMRQSHVEVDPVSVLKAMLRTCQ